MRDEAGNQQRRSFDLGAAELRRRMAALESPARLAAERGVTKQAINKRLHAGLTHDEYECFRESVKEARLLARESARRERERNRVEKAAHKALLDAHRLVVEYENLRANSAWTARKYTNTAERWRSAQRCDSPDAGTETDHRRHIRRGESPCEASMAIHTIRANIIHYRKRSRESRIDEPLLRKDRLIKVGR